MNKKFVWLVAALLVLVLALAGCSGGDAPDEGVVVSDGPAPGSGEAILEDAAGDVVPEDVPVMPGAYNLDVVRESTQINFTIDADLQTVIDWYAVELEANGWLATRSPDSAIGAMGSMTRENAAGDKISLNLSFNQVSNATTVAIAISRH